MKSFKEYYEEQEYTQIDEGVSAAIGNILGFGTVGVLGAWAAALIVKGGVGAYNSIAKTLGKNGVSFKKKFKEENNDSKAVKDQINRMNSLEAKYGKELENVLKAIEQKNTELAATAYRDLDYNLKNSTEVKQIVIEKIIKVYKEVPIAEPTPGNESYKAIRKVIDMATAKAVAKSLQMKIQKYLEIEE